MSQVFYQFRTLWDTRSRDFSIHLEGSCVPIYKWPKAGSPTRKSRSSKPLISSLWNVKNSSEVKRYSSKLELISNKNGLIHFPLVSFKYEKDKELYFYCPSISFSIFEPTQITRIMPKIPYLYSVNLEHLDEPTNTIF